MGLTYALMFQNWQQQND